jgi:hypothetical protein
MRGDRGRTILDQAMAEGDYRDELAAAHARIADLEQELAELRGGGGSAEPWLHELEAKRAAAIAEGTRGLGDPKRRWKVRGIIVGIAMALAAVVSVMVGSFWPFIPFGVLALHPTMVVIYSIGKKRQQTMKQELAKIDEKVADVRRMAAMMGAARIRVDPSAQGASAAEEVDVALDDARRARRG